MTRRAVVDAKRVVVKVGSSSLTTAAGGLDPVRLAALVDVLADVRRRGAEVVLVFIPGAIAAGLAPLGLKRRPRALAAQQAAASVGQGLLVHRSTEELARHGVVVGQVLLTLDDVTRRSHYREPPPDLRQAARARRASDHQRERHGREELKTSFGDNDRLAAMVTNLVRAPLAGLSDVEGLYDGDPATGPRG